MSGSTGMRIRFAQFCFVAILTSSSLAVAATRYSFELDGDQVVPAPSGSSAVGRAAAVLNDTETEVTLAVEHDVVSPIAGAVYRGDFDTNGTFVLALSSLDAQSVTAWQPTPAEVADLKSGLLYLQIDSALHPTGDIRGQVAPKRHPAPGDVLISEIMYNPRSDESGPSPAEWIELFNRTYSDIEIGGWYFEDEDVIFGDFCTPQRSGTIPPFVLRSGNVVVVIPDAGSNPPSVADFESAWGIAGLLDVIQLLPDAGTANGAIVGLTLSNTPVNDGNDTNDFPLANSLYQPCDTNGLERPDDEILTLMAESVVMDTVNYDDQSPWPADDGSASISLVPADYPINTDLSSYTGSGNDIGTHWILHAPGDLAGGRRQSSSAGVYGGNDIGSPGYLIGALSANLPPTIESMVIVMGTDAEADITLQASDNTRPFLGLLLFFVKSLPAHGTLIDATSEKVLTPADVTGAGYLIPRPPFTNLRYISDTACGRDSFTVQATDGVLYSPDAEIELIVQCADVAVTEIMYNPNSFEGFPSAPEWVEILNTSDAPLDLVGWYLEDDSARSGDLPSYILGPNEAVAVIPSASVIAEFQSAWNAAVVQVTTNGETSAGALVGFNLGNLSGDNLRLVKPGGPTKQIVDAVYYGNGGDWPDTNTSGDGVSIYVTPPASQATAVANDSPLAWARAVVGVDGAYEMLADTNGIYNGFDVGSPGHVEGITVLPCPAPPDQNGDGTVGLSDFVHFSLCFGGPTGVAPGNCACFDTDGNDRLDLFDFAFLQQAFAAP